MRKVEIIKKIFSKTGSTIYWNLYFKPLWIIKLTVNPGKWVKHRSYFPDKKQKSKFHIYIDQIIQIVKFGYPNEFYFPYGFDVKTKKEIDKYLHYRPFMKLRNSQNISAHGATAILRDKFYFGMFCEYLGINSGNNIGVLYASNVYVPQIKNTIGLQQFCNYNKGEYFVKLINGECGKDIFVLSLSSNNGIMVDDKPSNIERINNLTQDGRFLIQKKVEQHPIMASLHPQSLNTIRLVTVRSKYDDQIVVFPSILRVGTGKSFVDNTSQGGLAIAIDIKTGKLGEYGFYKPEYGTRTDRHPDSNIKFSEFTIPYFEKAKQQAIFLHSMLPSVHSIGWDIAIGKEEPIFIEGNDNWEINGPQICNGPLKALWNSLAK